jgi:hypothetical protein
MHGRITPTRAVLTRVVAGLAVVGAAAGLTLAGSASARSSVSARSAVSSHSAASSPEAVSSRGAAASSWRVRTVAALPSRLASIVVSPRRSAAFELTGAHDGSDGPFRLHRVGLAHGAARTGGQFPVSQLSLASGYLWVTGSVIHGQHGRAVLYQVSPATLKVVRSWRLTRWGTIPDTTPVTGGPDGTVWAGYGQHLRRISPRTGATLSRVRLSSRLLLSDTAADPSGRHLYVSAGTRRAGAVVSEYAGGSGRLLARQAGGPLRFAANGGEVMAAPGGAWPSFRTGMEGETILLRRAGLRVVPLPTRNSRLYTWDMGATTTYGGGSVWLSQVITGKTACIAPSTGRVRSSATLRQLNDGGFLLAVSSGARLVYATARAGLVAISAPRTCWR